MLLLVILLGEVGRSSCPSSLRIMGRELVAADLVTIEKVVAGLKLSGSSDAQSLSLVVEGSFWFLGEEGFLEEKQRVFGFSL